MSDKRGRTAIGVIICSIVMLFFLPLIVYMGIMGNIKDIKIDTVQAQKIVIQNLSAEDKETLTHLETVMNNIQTEFQNRKLDNYTIKRHRRYTLVPFLMQRKTIPISSLSMQTVLKILIPMMN